MTLNNNIVNMNLGAMSDRPASALARRKTRLAAAAALAPIALFAGLAVYQELERPFAAIAGGAPLWLTAATATVALASFWLAASAGLCLRRAAIGPTGAKDFARGAAHLFFLSPLLFIGPGLQSLIDSVALAPGARVFALQLSGACVICLAAALIAQAAARWSRLAATREAELAAFV